MSRILNIYWELHCLTSAITELNLFKYEINNNNFFKSTSKQRSSKRAICTVSICEYYSTQKDSKSLQTKSWKRIKEQEVQTYIIREYRRTKM